MPPSHDDNYEYYHRESRGVVRESGINPSVLWGDNIDWLQVVEEYAPPAKVTFHIPSAYTADLVTFQRKKNKEYTKCQNTIITYHE